MARAPNPPKTVDVSKLMKKVDGLLDESPPQVDDAVPLLRQVLEVEPERLMALHSLSWALDASRRTDPYRWERELKAEHWKARDRVLALTRGTRSGGKLSDAQRARSLALSLWAEEVVRGVPTDAQLDAVEAALEEAEGLRPLPDHGRARRGLDAWRAVRQGPGKKGYPVLLAQVEESPEQRLFDVEDDAPECFSGLQGAFSDEGFVAWLRKQKPAARPKGKKAQELDAGVLFAAGQDAAPFFGPGFGGGRVARVLALRALGASLESRNEDGQGLLHLAAMVDDAPLVKALLGLGLSASAVDGESATPLHLAAEKGAVSCISVLVKGGAPVDALDENGRTALFNARSPEVAQALLDSGANPNAGAGWTPLLGAPRPSGGAKGTLDLQPLLSALAKQKASLLKAWYFEDKDVGAVERVLKSLWLQGVTSWDAVATGLQHETPWTVMAVVALARTVLPSDSQAKDFTGAPRFVLGDLALQGSVHLDGPLLVTGDLTVRGVLRNAGPEGLLVVGGSLRATGVDSDGEVVVGGDLEAQVVWGHHNDNSLRVGGKLKADVVIEDDHDVQARVKARHHFKNGEFDATSTVLKKVFVRAAFASGELEREALFDLLRAGKSVLG
ncbi:ankyrin repeat domain-containing protein [Stigmatella sp. ncwal1]|uniref:Ankyrin repeat domain-containing protein n=1 Tax=Stigmatella ashevillensis TaxID=2995309 RepID=A0ABT5DDC6_9BACT|nr:ankyrin repeat domain-containing protein [Stigmatella ashevillena]MDC0711685.1 ankyrin repeat domain-containing protein [Stigmatella ashevillena]